MTRKEKKRKAAMIAVAYYIEQEKQANTKGRKRNLWREMGVELNMHNHQVMGRRFKHGS